MEDVATKGCKNKEVLSSDHIVNAIVDISHIDKVCQSHGVNRIFISRL